MGIRLVYELREIGSIILHFFEKYSIIISLMFLAAFFGWKGGINIIYESYDWKLELEKEMKRIKRYIKNVTYPFPDDFDFRMERFYFLSAFIIRKLRDSYKLSDEMCKMQFPCVRYKKKPDPLKVDFLNNHKIDQFYDWGSAENAYFMVKSVNQFIHSFFFTLCLDEECNFIGIYYSSDQSKDKYMYYLSFSTYMDFITKIINDGVTNVEFNRITGLLKLSSK